MNKDLRAANVAKDEAERLLSNLEKLKAEGSMQETEYETLDADYCKMRDDAISEINSIEAQLQKNLDAKAEELETCKQELANLEARFRVGEIPAKSYKKQEKGLSQKIADLQENDTAAKKNCFERHLNWTWVLVGIVGAFLLSVTVGLVLVLLVPELPDEYIDGTMSIVGRIGFILVSLWVLNMKGRHWCWIFLAGLGAPLWLNNQEQLAKQAEENEKEVK